MSSSDARDGGKSKRNERIVAALLGATIVAAAGFAIVSATTAQTQLAAGFLTFALASLAAAMVVYEHEIMPRREYIEDRGSLPSGEPKVQAAADAFLEGVHVTVGTRRNLLTLFAGAVAALGVAALVPLRAFAPRGVKTADVAATNWRRGLRLVRENGRVVRSDDLAVDSMVTVFPEGFTGPAFSQAMTNDATVIVRVKPEEIQLPGERAQWAPGGILAFSKVCTHAGCPVALYRAAARQLFCPCHQSTFDVLTGGTRVFGPAARPLPQLPLMVGEDGALTASDGFPEPIGPDYWERA